MGRDGSGWNGTGRDGSGRVGMGRVGTGRDGSGRDGSGRVGTGREVKYKLHKCYVDMGQPNQAINILQSIVAKNRTGRVSMALGRLYHQNGMERLAIATYREVVRECPLALEP